MEGYDQHLNETGLRANLDLLEERRENAVIRMANYKQVTTKYFGKIQPRQFQEGDKVLRSTAVSDPSHTKKLDPTLEGPYVVQRVQRPETYSLARLNGEKIPNTWHATHLKRFYP